MVLKTFGLFYFNLEFYIFQFCSLDVNCDFNYLICFTGGDEGSYSLQTCQFNKFSLALPWQAAVNVQLDRSLSSLQTVWLPLIQHILVLQNDSVISLTGVNTVKNSIWKVSKNLIYSVGNMANIWPTWPTFPNKHNFISDILPYSRSLPILLTDVDQSV